jgi:hypothetical protein
MTSRKKTPRITDRDIEILRGLFESRIMTLAQLASIYFEGKYEATKKRLQTLRRSGLIAERPRYRAYDRSILFLAKSGFSLLRAGGHVRDFPRIGWESMEKRVRVSPLTLRHEIAVNDIKASLMDAARRTPGLAVPQFLTWPRLFAFQANTDTGDAFGRETTIRPDGFIRIEQRLPDEVVSHLAYLEVDRSTESLETLRLKALGYLDHYRSGGLATWIGRQSVDYKAVPFRVLIVLRNAERRNNLAAAFLTMHRPVLQLTWLTTTDEVLVNPLGDIWMRPKDFRDATLGTPFEAKPRFPEEVYRRTPEREAFIAKSVRLLPLVSLSRPHTCLPESPEQLPH